MSRSNNSRRGSREGNFDKEFWSRRADSKVTGSRGAYAKKRTHRIERQTNKVKDKDFE